jgi:ribonuclease HII
MNSISVPGAKAIAQGSLKVATSFDVNGVTGPVVAEISVVASAVSPVSAFAQLASAKTERDNAAVRLKERIMLGVTPGFTFAGDGIVIGVDEAGRGPLAGPVVAAAVVLGREIPAGLDDSKRLSAARRAKLETAIRANCCWAVAVVEPEEIDRLNIFIATMEAMTRAVAALTAAMAVPVNEVLIDGNMTPQGRCAGWGWPARAIVGGDGIEPAISAASIIAKEWRDRMMRDAAKAHPHYGWERNKGYGTAEHMAALQEHGPTPLHRRSFAPVAQLTLF